MQEHAGQTGFLLLGDGLDAFVARILLARAAERSIDVQYYLYHDDLVSRLFTDQLLEAADRGVRVRLLVDDMDLEGRDLGAVALDAHPNVEVRIFNPFSRKSGRIGQFVTRMGSVTRRMHNKSFTVDNQVAILGGRNMGNEYFDADPELAFSDLDVMALGPATRKVSTAFDLYWNSELAYPASVLIGKPPTTEEITQLRQDLSRFVAQQSGSAYLQALRNSSLANAIRQNSVRFNWGEAVVLYDLPEKILKDFDESDDHLAPKLRPFAERVRDELIIFSPYFVPGKRGTTFLTRLAKQGVKVRILTNSLASTDVGIVHAGYSKYRKDLLRSGVELYELNAKFARKEREGEKEGGRASKASLHAKSFVFDRRKVFIGSLNLDPRAIVHNTEIGLVLASETVASEMSDWFSQNVEEMAFRLELTKQGIGEKILWHGLVDGKAETFDVDPHTSFWRRLGIGLIGLLPIESQL
jgi:putative cardiolipin synthase